MAPVVTSMSAHVVVGEMVHLAGPNGVGKSTAVELASGYLRPWSGEVLVHGEPAGSPMARRARRVVRTSPSLHPELTVTEHLEIVAARQAEPVESVRARADELGLMAWARTEAKALSTGNARKLWLLLCTAGDFDLVVLDEPFNGLDDAATQATARLLDSWRHRCAVVLVAHLLPAVVRPDRVVDLAAWSRTPAGTP